MKKTLLPVLVILLLAWLVLRPGLREGSLSSNPQRSTTRLVMGSLATITTWNVPDALERRAVAEAFAAMEEVDRQLSRHRPDSEVSRINQAPRNEAQALPPTLLEVLQAGLALSEATSGRFHLGLEPLIRLWGFSAETPPTQPPPAETVAAWKQAWPGLDGLRLVREGETTRIILANDRVGLDLGGIGQGYGADRAAAVLREAGVVNALIDVSGDVRVLGSKGEFPWRVGIQNPRQPGGTVAVVGLRGDTALVTSGDYEQFYLYNSRRYHHILDPLTGEPAQSQLASVSILAPQAMLADALSTAFFVVGAQAGQELLRRFPGVEALWVTTNGVIGATGGFPQP
ncbi:MAG: FAD:protein FMN transferase [Magnetococcales bacterium]|nr:FAD:protein FMN transferase [Magnetococcales bacterium]